MPNIRTYITNPRTTAINRYYYGSVQHANSDDRFEIAPVVKIKDDAPVDTDQEGRYIIRISEPEFTGDIASFLGIQIAA